MIKNSGTGPGKGFKEWSVDTVLTQHYGFTLIFLNERPLNIHLVLVFGSGKKKICKQVFLNVFGYVFDVFNGVLFVVLGF